MTRQLLLHLLLAAIWTALTGELSSPNFALGFVVGFLVLRVSQPLIGPVTYLERLWFFMELIGGYLKNLFLSSVGLTRIILSPHMKMESGIIAIPLDVRTDLEITMLANFISLTPGTLSMYVAEDRRTLFIHVIDIGEGGVDHKRNQIKQTLERRVKKVMHPERPAASGPPHSTD